MESLPTLARLGIFRSSTPTAIFVVCILVSAGVLLYYANRHPHPRFRPKLGELVLVAMIFFGISIAITAMTSSLFDQENLDEGAKKARKRANAFSDRKRTTPDNGELPNDDKDRDKDSTSDDSDTPPFVPDE